MAGLLFWKKKRFLVGFERVQRGFLSERRGRSFHVDGPKTEKAREPKVESGARNLEAVSIRSRAKSTGGCVNLKTVTEIRGNSARLSCTVLNSLLDWEPVEKLT